MPLFSSKREKRLWLSVLLVLLAIYLALGFASSLAGLLRDRELLTPVLFFCLFLVGATVVTQGLQTRPRVMDIAIALGIAAVYLLMFARMAIPEQHRGHLIEYSVVAVFVYEALKERASQGRRVPLPAWTAILITSLLGFLDECIQILLPNRVFDPFDIWFNFWAAVIAVGVSVGLEWGRNYLGKRRKEE